MYVCV
jgi:hypothetical protein